MSLGVEKLFEVNKDFIIIGGLAARNYFTISQRYHLPFDNSFIPQPELQIQNNYQTSKKENFGFGGELNLGILKKIGKLYIGPSLIIPVYDSWKQDSIFPTENSSGSRNKLLRGLGANIKFIYTIK
jgi:hypothetical protein